MSTITILNNIDQNNVQDIWGNINSIEDEKLHYFELGLIVDKIRKQAPVEIRNELNLIFEICSLHLEMDKPDPYKDLMCDNVILSGDEFRLLEKLLNIVKTPKIIARINDILWERSLFYKTKDSPPNTDFAINACKIYLSYNVDNENLSTKECLWKRGVILASLLRGNKYLDRLIKEKSEYFYKAFIEIDLQSSFKTYTPMTIAEVLLSFNKKHTVFNAVKVIDKIKEIALLYLERNDFFVVHRYLNLCSEWCRTYLKNDELERVRLIEGDAHYKEALLNENMVTPNYMLSSRYFQEAVVSYKKISKKVRNAHNVDEKIKDCLNKKRSADKKKIQEMSVIRSGSIDLSEIKARAEEIVEKDNLLDALLSLANIKSWIDIEKIKNNVENSLVSNPLQFAFSIQRVKNSGRDIIVRPSYNFHDKNDIRNEEVFRCMMVDEYIENVGMFSLGCLIPAIKVIQQHNPNFEDFLNIVEGSRLVEQNRIQIVATGFYTGFTFKMIESIHIIAPQMENFVRAFLKGMGAVTHNTEDNNEYGLSTLIEKDELKNCFSVDQIFEIKSLFCDKFGPNIRNEVAHGLIVDNEIYPVSIYIWWWFFRFFVNAYYINLNAGLPE